MSDVPLRMRLVTVMEQPQGTITFLFTDIVGSSGLWDRNEQAMTRALARHNAILEEAISANGGFLFGNPGDGYCVAFGHPNQALAAAVAGQQQLMSEVWPLQTPIRVRMGVHCGSAETRNGNYVGREVGRAQRVMEAGNGGQIVISGAAADLARPALQQDWSLLNHGELNLRDLARPERLFTLLYPGAGDQAPLRTLDHVPNNLPRILTEFVGREQELSQLDQYLSERALVTLVGTGGSGKTRLALQAAANRLYHYPDGVFLVELAGLTDGALVAESIAATLGIRVSSERYIVDELARHMTEHKRLIILDNCEHLVESVNRVLVRLLKSATNARVLVTSRSPLGLRGEQMMYVDGLSMIAKDGGLSDAAQMFVQRALEVRSGFSADGLEAGEIDEICRSLEGMPLLLEITASRLRMFTVSQLLPRLTNRLNLLRGPQGFGNARQRTLEATIQWSYELLAPPEKRLFAGLTVFSGGWTAEAVEAVFKDNPDALTELQAIVDQSLVSFNDTTGRFRMSESVREFALKVASESEPAKGVRENYFEYYAAMSAEAAVHAYAQDDGKWLDILHADIHNLRSCLKTGPKDRLLELAVNLHRYWLNRGTLLEAQSVLTAQLNAGGNQDPLLMGVALNVTGHIHFVYGRFSEARSCFSSALALLTDCGATAQSASVMNNEAMLLVREGRNEEARARFFEAAQVFQKANDLGRARSVLNNAAVAYMNLREFAVATEIIRQVLDMGLQRDHQATIAAALNLAEIGMLTNDRDCFKEGLATALRLSPELNSTPLTVELLVRGVRFAIMEGRVNDARLLLKQADTVAEEHGLPKPSAGDSLIGSDVLDLLNPAAPGSISAGLTVNRNEKESLVLLKQLLSAEK